MFHCEVSAIVKIWQRILGKNFSDTAGYALKSSDYFIVKSLTLQPVYDFYIIRKPQKRKKEKKMKNSWYVLFILITVQLLWSDKKILDVYKLILTVFGSISLLYKMLL